MPTGRVRQRGGYSLKPNLNVSPISRLNVVRVEHQVRSVGHERPEVFHFDRDQVGDPEAERMRVEQQLYVRRDEVPEGHALCPRRSCPPLGV